VAADTKKETTASKNIFFIDVNFFLGH
jgi:hypothetical protein